MESTNYDYRQVSQEESKEESQQSPPEATPYVSSLADQGSPDLPPQIEVALNDDFLELDDDPTQEQIDHYTNYTQQMMQELLEAQYQLEYQEEIQRAIHQSIIESNKANKEPFGRRLKAKLKKIFSRKKKNQLDAVQGEDDFDQEVRPGPEVQVEAGEDEVITFVMDVDESMLRGASVLFT